MFLYLCYVSESIIRKTPHEFCKYVSVITYYNYQPRSSIVFFYYQLIKKERRQSAEIYVQPVSHFFQSLRSGQEYDPPTGLPFIWQVRNLTKPIACSAVILTEVPIWLNNNRLLFIKEPHCVLGVRNWISKYYLNLFEFLTLLIHLNRVLYFRFEESSHYWVCRILLFKP